VHLFSLGYFSHCLVFRFGSAFLPTIFFGLVSSNPYIKNFMTGVMNMIKTSMRPSGVSLSTTKYVRSSTGFAYLNRFDTPGPTPISFLMDRH
jgi:hypothetical protein